MSEKKIELIAQLLAKAESTTPEEAEALTEHAERLMLKYMIDQAQIDERRAKNTAPEKIVEEHIVFTGGFRGELLHMANQVVYGLGQIRAMQYTGGDRKQFHFYLVGFESDVAQAKTLINSLQVQAVVAVRSWWKENKGDYRFDTGYNQEKARRAFVHGFGTGAGRRIFDSRQKVVQESSAGTELVLVSRRDKVDEFMSHKKLGKARSWGSLGNEYAQGSGYRAGQNANTGERSMTQGRGISA